MPKILKRTHTFVLQNRFALLDWKILGIVTIQMWNKLMVVTMQMVNKLGTMTMQMWDKLHVIR